MGTNNLNSRLLHKFQGKRSFLALKYENAQHQHHQPQYIKETYINFFRPHYIQSISLYQNILSQIHPGAMSSVNHNNVKSTPFPQQRVKSSMDDTGWDCVLAKIRKREERYAHFLKSFSLYCNSTVITERIVGQSANRWSNYKN